MRVIKMLKTIDLHMCLLRIATYMRGNKHAIRSGSSQMVLDHVVEIDERNVLAYGWLYSPGCQIRDLHFFVDGNEFEPEGIFAVDRPDVLTALSLPESTPSLGFAAFFDREDARETRGRLWTMTTPTRGGESDWVVAQRQTAAKPGIDVDSLLAAFSEKDKRSPELASVLSRIPSRHFVRFLRRLSEEGAKPEAHRIFWRHAGRIQIPQLRRREAADVLHLLIEYMTVSDPQNIAANRKQLLMDLVEELVGKDLISFQNCLYLLEVFSRLQEPGYKIKVARHAIRLADGDRDKIGDVVCATMPKDSKLWLRDTFGNKSLGDEQVSGALNTIGAAYRATGKVEVAMLYFEAASSVYEYSGIARLNAGWSALELGQVQTAFGIFSSIGRAYPHQSTVTLWPQSAGARWPHYSFDAAAFDAMLREGESWPRITLVTPSYNQGQFIEETILSILNQNYPKLQYIIVDGDSKDGTPAVLEQYHDQVSEIIIEPDNGQTEAINKGLKHANGEIIGWLNSDDMLAPGALHALAMATLHTDADLIAGICIVHHNGQIVQIKKPEARAENFDVATLSDIFHYWLKGYFFYQPEVFFTRAALERAGGLLDENLYFTMDYDLWLKLAKAGMKLDVIDWPIAMFRRHDRQKTVDLTNCIEEQAKTRNKYLLPQPSFNRIAEIRDKIGAFQKRKDAHVAVVSGRIGTIFSAHTQADFDQLTREDFRITFSGCAEDLDDKPIDAVIYLVHLQDDVLSITHLRKMHPECPVVGWFWDNHHHPFLNFEVVEALDVAIPGHASYSQYLRNVESVLFDTIPLCVTQWDIGTVSPLFKQIETNPRSDALYGGFVHYAYAPKRNNFIETVRSRVSNNAIRVMFEDDLEDYFGVSEGDRFQMWCQYKTSIVVPRYNDLSQRVFDALLAGQIPLVPTEIADLDVAISPQLQRTLPIVRFSMKDPPSVERAYKKAISAFDEGGLEAARERHRYAKENHMFSRRVQEIVRRLLEFQ